ncbi:hypothetical protein LX36DRAFT_656473 [Colletotrichum falcatum]|nr:hypothetical protein LX36DRAFT_656473 [Colletotrichum falcatum]
MPRHVAKPKLSSLATVSALQLPMVADDPELPLRKRKRKVVGPHAIFEQPMLHAGEGFDSNQEADDMFSPVDPDWYGSLVSQRRSNS